MDLQEFIAASNGISLHRTRVLTAFSHVPDGPLTNLLFNLTRPPLRAKSTVAAVTALTARTLGKTAGPAIARKGMVNYRREFLGLKDTPE